MSQPSPVRVVLHGGLGNQLFQLFYAKNLAMRRPGTPVHLHSELLQRYETARDFELNCLVQQNRLVSIQPIGRLCRLRLPKLAYRLTKQEREWNIPGVGLLVDGYFQTRQHYERFNRPQLLAVIDAWRSRLGLDVTPKPEGRQLVHIRLGDFFQSDHEAMQYVAQRLQQLDPDIDVMSNQENLVSRAIEALGRSGRTRVIITRELDSWSLLRRMASYPKIQTNGSTLAFWAACLSAAALQTTDHSHQMTFRHLRPD